MNHDDTLRLCNILIVDDNQSFSQILEVFLKEIGVGNVFKAESLNRALSIFDDNEINICLLDIDLGVPYQSGIELAEKIRLRNQHMPIIFLTSNYTEEYYNKTKYIYPIGFMNKELSHLKLIQAIELALLNTQNQDEANNRNSMHPHSTPYNISDEIAFFKIGNVFKGIKFKNILYFFTKDRLVFARVNNRNYPTNIKLKVLERVLSPSFIRIHRAYLVNVSHIESIHPKDGKIEIGKEFLPIGYSFKDAFFEKMNLMK